MGSSVILLNRRLVLAGLVLGPQSAIARLQSRPQRILFVCPAGSVKSAIAREVLKTRARELGLVIEVRSRGVVPEDHVSPGLAARLQADGIDVAAQPLTALSSDDLAWADKVIGFDSALQAPGMAQAEAWEIPSWNEAYDQAKAALIPHIEVLINALVQARQGIKKAR